MKKNFAGIVTLVMLFTFIFAGASLAEEKKITLKEPSLSLKAKTQAERPSCLSA